MTWTGRKSNEWQHANQATGPRRQKACETTYHSDHKKDEQREDPKLQELREEEAEKVEEEQVVGPRADVDQREHAAHSAKQKAGRQKVKAERFEAAPVQCGAHGFDERKEGRNEVEERGEPQLPRIFC